MKRFDHKTVLLILRLSCLLLFAGRAWQHLVWGAPYRSILWDQSLLEPFVRAVYGSWDQYAADIRIEHASLWIANAHGYFYAFCAVLCVMPFAILKRFRVVFLWSTFALAGLFGLLAKEKFMEVGMFIEHAGQMLSPLLLYIALGRERSYQSKLFKRVLQIAIIGTFVGHGLYAVGYYPVPGNFIDMCINILHVSQSQAKALLFIAGLIDFAIGAVVFLQWGMGPLLTYACFWGFVTALARPIACFDAYLWQASLWQWLPEFIFRMPHALLPFLALGLWRRDTFSRKSFSFRKIVSLSA